MAEKSALRLIPGKDALLEYTTKTYDEKTYVEYNGLIYKAKVDTSATFVPSEWTLISDLREVRVPNIAARNALTGSTPTSGTTGITIPILDNTNVLVLNATADPAVGSNKFARYNYNKPTNTFLLLQISTGSTASNVSDYTLLTNKPLIISGITATAGNGLTGGAVLSGNVPPNRVTFSFAHADTSALADIANTGYTYVQKLRFDTYGHVTGATQSTWTHPDTSNQASVSNTGVTYIQSVQLDSDGHVASIGSATWTHPDTSSQASVTNTGSTVIQSIVIDGNGHITSIGSATVSTGGGGVNFSVNGNSGGAASMPNSGILQITGGTNIQTVSSLNGSNVGLRINVLASGSNGQLQLNNSGSLGFGAGLTFLSTRLTTPNINISTTPPSGTTSHNFLLLNATGGTTRFAFNSLANVLSSAPLNANQYKTATGFGGNAEWLFVPATKSVTLGVRSAGGVGVNSLLIGTGIASGASSIAHGLSNITLGAYSYAGGSNNLASGIGSHVEGIASIASGQYSHSEGNTTVASGTYSHSEGLYTIASGSSSHSGGGGTSTRQVLAKGVASFNHSENNVSQTIGHGALADNSAILGGINHNIATGNTRAAIIGGTGIKLTGSTYSDHVVVPSLAVFTTPSAGSSDDILTWNATTKKVGKILQSSLTGVGVSLAAFNFYTGTTAPALFLLKTAFNVYSGTTAPATYVSKTIFNVYTGTTAPATYVTKSAYNAYTAATNITLGQTITGATNGLNKVGKKVLLGGTVTGNTVVNVSATRLLTFSGATKVTSLSGGTVAITTTPGAGGSDDILTWNPTTKRINKVAQASLTGAGVSLAAFNFYTGTTAPSFYLLKTAFNTFSGTTLPNNYLSKSSFTTYTGTTAPATFANKAIHNAYTAATNITLGTFVSGATNGLTKVGKKIFLGGTVTGNTVINISTNRLLTFSGSTKFTALSGNTVAIINTPSTGGSEDLLTWNPTTKRINKVTQASITTGLVSTTAFNTYTGTTAPALFLSKTAFNTFSGTTLVNNYLKKTIFNVFTGTTAPATYASKTIYNAYTAATNVTLGQTITGATNGLTKTGKKVFLGGTVTGNTVVNVSATRLLTISGGTKITALSGNTIAIINSPTAGTGSEEILVRNTTTRLIGVVGTSITIPGNLQINGQAWAAQGTLTDGASIAWNLDTNPNSTVTLAGNRALANPTNAKAGGTYYMIVKQDAVGSRTLTFGSNYKWANATPPTLTATANAVDILTFISDGTNMYGVVTPNLG